MKKIFSHKFFSALFFASALVFVSCSSDSDDDDSSSSSAISEESTTVGFYSAKQARAMFSLTENIIITLQVQHKA